MVQSFKAKTLQMLQSILAHSLQVLLQMLQSIPVHTLQMVLQMLQSNPGHGILYFLTIFHQVEHNRGINDTSKIEDLTTRQIFK